MNRFRKLKKHSNALQILREGDSKICKQVLRDGGASLMNCLCEISHNILKGNVPLTMSQKKKLSPYKHTLRQLTNNQKISLVKKKHLVQRGGFLSALLGPVLTLLGGFLRT